MIICQKIARKKYVGENFDFKKLRVQIINFFGEGIDKFASVKDKIGEFLQAALNDSSYSQKVLENWFTLFMINCTDKPDNQKKFELSKKEIIFPIILICLDNLVTEAEFNKVCEYDDFYELQREYRKTIERKIVDYEFFIRVIGSFMEMKSSANNITKFDFVGQKWRNYLKDFSIIKDEEKKEALIKYLLLSIITKKTKICNVKETANLQ